MAWGGQLEKSAVSLRCFIHISAKILPCSCLFSTAHPVGSPQTFCSKMTFSCKEKLLMLQQMGNGSGELGVFRSPESQGSFCMHFKLWQFVLVKLGAQWMARAACGCQTGSWHGGVCLVLTLGIGSSCPQVSTARGQGLLQFSPEYLSLFHVSCLCMDKLLNCVCALFCHGCLSDMLVSVFLL